jgi:hypothetical protein
MMSIPERDFSGRALQMPTSAICSMVIWAAPLAEADQSIVSPGASVKNSLIIE